MGTAQSCRLQLLQSLGAVNEVDGQRFEACFGR